MIDKKKPKRIHFYYEYLLILIQFIQPFINSSKVNFSLGLLYFTLYYKKTLKEGTRLLNIFSITNELIILIETFKKKRSFLLKLIPTITNSVIFYLTLIKFKLYQLPNSKVKHSIGHKLLSLGPLEKDNIGVFYPCKEKFLKNKQDNRKKLKWMSSKEGFKCLVDTSRLGMPKFLEKVFYYTLNFLLKFEMDVENEGELIITKENKILIFIPGLGGNRNTYSIFTSYLASIGYIVFSMNPIEDVILENDIKEWKIENLPILKECRMKQLIDRADSVTKVLDFACDLNQMRNFFNKSDLNINYNNVSIGGHSFGGTTSYISAINDKRINGGIFILDPWYFPMPEKYYQEKIKLPFITICSETFNSLTKKYWNNEFNIERIMKFNEENDKMLVCTFKGCDHLSQTDLPYILMGELILVGLFKKVIILNKLN